jgi:hypothetical protein
MVNARAPIALRIIGKMNDRTGSTNSPGSASWLSRNRVDPMVWNNCQRNIGNNRNGRKVKIPRTIF